MLAAKDKMDKRIGSYTFFGYDIAIDDEWNQYMIEFNYYVKLKFKDGISASKIY